MHRDTHVKIVKALSEKLHLPKEYEDIFVEGVTAPDMWRLKNPRRKHHYVIISIFGYIMQARIYYVKGEIFSCLYNLGIALHFVQDAHVPSPGTKSLSKKHDALENRIRWLPIPEEGITAGFNSAYSSPKFVKAMISSIKWTYEADQALVKATRISAAVFGPKEPPEHLLAEYTKAKKDHKSRVKKGIVISIAGIMLGLLASASLVITYFIIFLTLMASMAFVSADKRFYELEEEANWYGIKRTSITPHM